MQSMCTKKEWWIQCTPVPVPSPQQKKVVLIEENTEKKNSETHGQSQEKINQKLKYISQRTSGRTNKPDVNTLENY